MKLLPKWSDEEHCKLILDALRIQNFDEQKRNKYANDMYDELKRQGQLKAAREEGHIDVAINMLKDGIAIDQICRYTGLTEAQVAELQALL